jgi:1,4-alpha-glucan branching enzyme
MSVLEYRESRQPPTPQPHGTSAGHAAAAAIAADDAHHTQLFKSLLQGQLTEAFALLGPRYESHERGEQGIAVSAVGFGPGSASHSIFIRSFQPGAVAVEVICRSSGASLGQLTQLQTAAHEASGLFCGRVEDAGKGDRSRFEVPYRLLISWPQADGSISVQETEDPYAFGLLLGELDLHLLAEGRHRELANCLGARAMKVDGVPGTSFAVWAPNARRVSVVGHFNQWDGRRHIMRLRHAAGVWELFIPRLSAGAIYKYEIVGPDGTLLPIKADPVARATELPPATASVVADPADFQWHDGEWMAQRPLRQDTRAPISIYEVHPGSWRRIPEQGNRNLSWHELADTLIPYACEMGFTHLELMPVMEHPFGGSWGYQPIGLFAPSARFGEPAGFAAFVDRCHQAGLGVLLDWVPAHFPSDAHGLAQFDGTSLYEHADPREGFHQDWNTLIFNLGRNEVRGFLIASALEWLERFHIDGLRVDAVASMLYRDYSRKSGEWVPNVHGGRENLEAVAFLRELNSVVAERCPGVLMIAEESTSWPGVTAGAGDQQQHHGLGFTYKWNMGWMNDSLRYMEYDPLFRRSHHHDLTFGLIYAFSERFILPISHDEVVHGKGTMLEKMPGDDWRKFANLRAYYGFMWTHPGKKLLFMGSEFGQYKEFDHDQSPQWELLEHEHAVGVGQGRHRQLQTLVRDLNRVYRREGAMHQKDCSADGFAWAVGNDSVNSVFAYFRFGEPGAAPLLAIVNMTPVPRHGYRIGVPPAADGTPGVWKEILNSDAAVYGGSNMGNRGAVQAQARAWHGQRASLELTLPPLSTLILRQEA